MTEEPDAARLLALEKRIEAARSKGDRKAQPHGAGFSQGEAAWRMVIELVSGMILGMGLGLGLDVLLGTRPILLVVFSLLGFGAGIRVMLGTARDVAKMKAGAPADRERD